MDFIADLCESARVQSATFTRVKANAPWGIKSADEPGVKVVLVASGAATLSMPSIGVSVALASGDVFIRLTDAPYEICDPPGAPLLDCAEVRARQVGDTIEVNGAGETTTFITGAFHLDEHDTGMLLSVLPPFLLMPGNSGRSPQFEAMLAMLAQEANGPAAGRAAATRRLFELMCIYSVRAYSTQQPHPKGWLGALADARLGDALRAMHGDPARHWTLNTLARRAAMSRATFAARFNQAVGQTPIAYLTRWRMHRAARLIDSRALSLSQVARAVGYQSESAFNRVFKREMGLSPGQFRRSRTVVRADHKTDRHCPQVLLENP